MALHFTDIEAALDHLLARLPAGLRVAAPLGLGKPHRLLNALYARVDAWVAAGWSEEQIRQHYREAEHAIALRDGLTAEQWQKCEDSNSTAMCADGVRLCCAKAREARALAA